MNIAIKLYFGISNKKKGMLMAEIHAEDLGQLIGFTGLCFISL